MGITDSQLFEFAKKIIPGFKSLNDLTPTQKNEIKQLYEKGVSDGGKSSTSSSSTDDGGKENVDLRSTGAAFESMSGPFVDIEQSATSLLNAFKPEGILKGVDELISKSQELANNMGVGRARADEFRAMIADSVPEMIKLGMEESEAMKVMSDIPATLKTNTTLTKETIIEIGAASKFSGVNAGELADKFKTVGMNLSDVGNRMAEAANYAKSVGVNVEAVTSKLVSNLGKLNLFNFDGGVKGMAKMVAQSEMLGNIMGSVMDKAESLLNPEAAIEFSSALQRLGVQSSALLDPLSAMDMALNDPAALQNEMVKVSQQFTRLKADGSGFEILPGAKLQLREVAKSLGMMPEQLAEMSIKSADLEMKMSKIRFPGFAASEEDKQLIANMAQMKDGKAVVTIAKKEGGTEEVNVEDLTAEQLEKLKEEQANQNKSAEEIARDQLSVLKDISQQLKGTERGITLGGASVGAIQRVTNTANELRRTVTTALTEKVTGESVRGKITPVLGTAEQGIIEAISTGDITKAFDEFRKLPGIITEQTGGIATGGLEALQNLLQKGEFNITKQYEGISGVKAGETNITGGLTQYIEELKKKIEGATTQEGSQGNINITQTLDVKGGADQITKDNVFKWNDEWLNSITNDPTKMNKVKEGMNKVNSGM